MNKKYWDKYYSKQLGTPEPSSFAVETVKLINQSEPILELGCGNGRDSFYFAKHGIKVYSLDQSEIVVNRIKGQNINPHFLCEDITIFAKNFNFNVKHCYARFFFHALNEKEENKALESIAKILPLNGMFFSENRSVKSSLYGIGQSISKDIYTTDHKRRFIRKNNLMKKLESLGFKIESIIESKGLAVYKDDDPVVIRITAKKTSDIK